MGPEPTNRRGLLRALVQSAGQVFGDFTDAVNAGQDAAERAMPAPEPPAPPPELTQMAPVPRTLTMAEFDALVAEAGLEDRRDALRALVRPATRLTSTLGAGPNRSWIGPPPGPPGRGPNRWGDGPRGGPAGGAGGEPGGSGESRGHRSDPRAGRRDRPRRPRARRRPPRRGRPAAGADRHGRARRGARAVPPGAAQRRRGAGPVAGAVGAPVDRAHAPARLGSSGAGARARRARARRLCPPARAPRRGARRDGRRRRGRHRRRPPRARLPDRDVGDHAARLRARVPGTRSGHGPGRRPGGRPCRGRALAAPAAAHARPRLGRHARRRHRAPALLDRPRPPRAPGLLGGLGDRPLSAGYAFAGSPSSSGWRITGRFAAPASSSRRTGVVYGAFRTTSGSSCASRRISASASANASSVSRVSVSVGSTSSASSTISGK